MRDLELCSCIEKYTHNPAAFSSQNLQCENECSWEVCRAQSTRWNGLCIGCCACSSLSSLNSRITIELEYHLAVTCFLYLWLGFPVSIVTKLNQELVCEASRGHSANKGGGTGPQLGKEACKVQLELGPNNPLSKNPEAKQRLEERDMLFLHHMKMAPTLTSAQAHATFLASLENKGDSGEIRSGKNA
ncbi:hypothetical protein NDU88_002803 [Pleurodeles waltl]|uniref:Uncharacterized protein n=1 Tax=Pleurodeles waltl TaxID=8319 RepID=A0AAV7MPY8_PLEWA|nr:hypothetical protein NDU88_002803 [Pleurodeles waltl]